MNFGKWFSRLVTILLLALLIFFVYQITAYGFKKVFIQHEADYVSAGVGAFFGSLSALVFLIFQALIARMYKRNKIHRDAIVKHERILNEYFGVISDNLFMLDDLIKSIENGALGLCNFMELPIDKSILVDTANLNYVNDAFTLNVDISKANNSFGSLTDLYNEIKELFLQGRLRDNAAFQSILIANVLPHARQLRHFLEDLESKTETLFAKNKAVFELSETPVDWIFKLVSPKSYYPRNFEKVWKKKLEKVQQDRKETMKRSQQEIEERQRRS